MVHKIELSLNLAASVHSELLQTLLKRGTLPLPGIHMQCVPTVRYSGFCGSHTVQKFKHF